ncbi:hypothetical protein, partial [Helicobacter sp. 11S03491-1]|uniref:hypothetical protein n=1 Tax=Helicobacter sp. 11S03491-1 TaxID=1476196 RepID=UPI00117A70F9
MNNTQNKKPIKKGVNTLSSPSKILSSKTTSITANNSNKELNQKAIKNTKTPIKKVSTKKTSAKTSTHIKKFAPLVSVVLSTLLLSFNAKPLEAADTCRVGGSISCAALDQPDTFHGYTLNKTTAGQYGLIYTKQTSGFPGASAPIVLDANKAYLTISGDPIYGQNISKLDPNVLSTVSTFNLKNSLIQGNLTFDNDNQPAPSTLKKLFTLNLDGNYTSDDSTKNNFAFIGNISNIGVWSS